MDRGGFIVLVIAIGALAIASVGWERVRSRTLLERWAEETGHRLLECDRAWLRRGPFWIRGKGQTIWRITVEDRRGQVRQAWARCGSFLFGLWSSDVEVQFDD